MAHAHATWRNTERNGAALIGKNLEKLGEKMSEKAQVKVLRDALNAVDATLSKCRHSASERREGCNCDIHAAHRIIADARNALLEDAKCPRCEGSGEACYCNDWIATETAIGGSK